MLLPPAESPFARPLVDGAVRVGNRFCVLPMEGWDGTTAGEPSDLTRRRWQRFGASGAKLVWGGEAVAVRHDGRANPNQLLLSATRRARLARRPRHRAPERFGPNAATDLISAPAHALAAFTTERLNRPALGRRQSGPSSGPGGVTLMTDGAGIAWRRVHRGRASCYAAFHSSIQKLWLLRSRLLAPRACRPLAPSRTAPVHFTSSRYPRHGARMASASAVGHRQRAVSKRVDAGRAGTAIRAGWGSGSTTRTPSCGLEAGARLRAAARGIRWAWACNAGSPYARAFAAGLFRRPTVTALAKWLRGAATDRRLPAGPSFGWCSWVG
jgi:hypothetical protein